MTVNAQPPRQIAIVRSYDELIEALRRRADELKISRDTIDAVSGLQGGYAGKLLAPVPIRTMGRTSLGPMLGALGIMIVLVEDRAMLDKIAKRMTPRRRNDDAGRKMLATKKRRKYKFPRGPEHARLMRFRQIAMQSESERSRIAQRAARRRWRRRKRQTKQQPEKPNRDNEKCECA